MIHLRTFLGVSILVFAALVSVSGGALAAPAADAGPATDVASLQTTQPASDSGLTFSPDYVNFSKDSAPLEPGETATTTLTIDNEASHPINVSSLRIEGDSGPFAITEPEYIEESFDFDGETVTAPAGSSEELTLQFAPEEPGTYQASVTFYGPDGTALASATAVGTAVADSNVTGSTHPLRFGKTTVGETGSQTVTLTNDSPHPLNVSSIQTSGDTDVFALTEPVYVNESTDFGGDTVSIPPGVSQDLTFEFAPRSPGSYEASVTLYDPHGNQLLSVRASGTGVSGPEVTATPGSLTFQETTVGETAAEIVTVTNDGDAALRVSETRIRGVSDYDVATSAPFVLEPGASEDVTVTFSPESTASQSALLEIVSNDTDQPVLPVSLSNSDTRSELTSTEDNGTRNVDVSVSNVRAGQEVDVTLPSPSNENDDVDVEQISVTPAKDGNLSLNVTDSSEPLATTPELETADNATGLKYMNVSKSVSNDDIEEVEYRYRIPKERVANLTTDPSALNESRLGNDTDAGVDAITMYRYVDGGWQEEQTRHVRETDTHHVFVTTGSGFSEWTTAAKRPDISVAEASAAVDATTVGEDVLVQVTLTNDGGADGVFVTKLLVDGEVSQTREVTVPDGGTVPVSFQEQFDQAKTYEVTVNGVSAGTIVVDDESGEAEIQSPSENQADDGSDGGDGSSGGDDGSSGGGDAGLLASQPVMVGAGVLVLLAALGAVLLVRGGEESSDPVPAEPVEEDDSVLQTEGFGAGDGTESTSADETDGAGNDESG